MLNVIRAQAASYIQIAKLMTNETSAGALRAKAENHLSKAKEANTDRPKQQGEHGQTVFFVKRLAGL
jgi:hypothetical protein